MGEDGPQDGIPPQAGIPRPAASDGVLVAGASGATGRLLVRRLLELGRPVTAVVRSPGRLPEDLRRHPRLTVVGTPVLELRPDQLAGHLAGCSAAASCLGHTMDARGILCPPWTLVRDSVRRLADASRGRPLRLVLMNTAGCPDPDAGERVPPAQRLVLLLLHLLLPPHRDNVLAAGYLRRAIGRDDPSLSWAAVRPDTLVDAGAASPYRIEPSPTTSAIFAPGRTSRANVADFMARLLTEEALWREWQGRMPVIYDRTG